MADGFRFGVGLLGAFMAFSLAVLVVVFVAAQVMPSPHLQREPDVRTLVLAVALLSILAAVLLVV